jgi:uncharacterized coiled-coil protein SlyX
VIALANFARLPAAILSEQQATIDQLKATAAHQQKQIEALTATVRKVSDRIVLSAPASAKDAVKVAMASKAKR